MRGRAISVLAALLPAPLAAQGVMEQPTRPNTILVSASGRVETAPDVATMTLSVRGDGKTPDAATAALAAKQKAILAGLRGLDARLEVRTGDIAFHEVRSGDCGGTSGIDDMSAVDTMVVDMEAIEDAPDAGPKRGPCRVTGHRATSETTVRLSAVKDAGTAVGLAGRLGATAARVENFTLRDDTAAARGALQQAMASARTQAAALAAASGSRLGPVVSIMNGGGDRGRRLMAMESYNVAAPPAIAPPPIVVDITPTPVETTAQIVVTFALLP